MLEVEQILQDRYQLQQKLGHNAGRQTWLACDLKNSDRQPVIIKILTFGGDIQWDDLKLFEREAQVLKQLNHPRIPKYCDYFSIDDRFLLFCLVQEYLPGTSLKEEINRGKRFTEQEIRQIAEDILNALIYLHQLNPPLLHRDIKPSNLIVGENKAIYLVDFGAVQDRPSREGASFTVVGTYGYTPIEQFGGRAVPSSDLYALGATLIHLLTGISPADLPQDNLRIQFADRVKISPSLVQWIQILVEPNLQHRFTTASKALEALKQGINIAPKLRTTTPKPINNNSGCGDLFNSSIPIPDEIKGWNWGAFFLSGFWPLTNRVWIGLLCWVPYIGSLGGFVLGSKGNEWAWKSRKWRSIEQFKAHQRGWTIAGLFFGIPLTWLYLSIFWLILSSFWK
jgi:serine/threonine protein kinase